MHEGLVRFPAVGSSIARMDRRLQSPRCPRIDSTIIVLSYSHRISADGIVDERAKVVDVCREPLV